MPSANKTYSIDINHITRVEGHGDIRLNVKEGKIEHLSLDIVEAPRFFELMLKGRPYKQVAPLTSRICGICSIAHTYTSLNASERAFGLKITEQTKLLRDIVYVGEMIASHILHICFLVLPDIFKTDSVIPLAATHPDVVKLALRLKKLGNDICNVLVGRKIHSISTAVNGFYRIPTKDEIATVRKMLVDSVGDIETLLSFAKATVKLPNFERETEYISLKHDTEYPVIHGKIYSSDTKKTYENEEYLAITNEYCPDNSTAKWTKHKRSSYFVGALARVNNNFDLLHPKAKEVANDFGLIVPCYNPFMNNVAQIVETVHEAYFGIEVCDKLLAKGLVEEDISFKPHAGRGVGVVEAPRGILFHDYTYDDEGKIVKANCIIPTNQNYGNIQDDLNAMVPTLLEQPKEDIALGMEMLVRAYDPCISCSVHLLNVEFV